MHAPRLVHGRTSAIHHNGGGCFAGLASPLVAARYHSLALVDLPGCLEVTAWSDDRGEGRVVMGLRHREQRLEGVQFHPESVLTEGGVVLMKNWLKVTS